MKTKRPPSRAKGKLEAKPAPASDLDKSAALAVMAVRPSINAAAVVSLYAKPLGIKEDDVGALMERLAEDVKDVWAGDLKRAEAMLFGQAHALQAIFMSLARRAESQQYLKQWEGYLRMALKAQNQCRMTLETLSTIKNPPVVIARQANINHGGQQQVNNGPAPATATSTHAGTQARATNPSIEQTELLEGSDGQRVDTGAASAAGGADPYLETVGAIDRPANR